MDIYVVKEGDTIEGISGEYGASPDSLIYMNQLVFPYGLAEGQALLVPALGGAGGEPYRAHTLGYAYPFISQWTLSQSLPALSALCVFSYGFTQDGELVEPVLSDEWMIHDAREQGADPVLTFTSIGPDGRFHSGLVQTLLDNESLQQRVIWNLGRTVQEKGYLGIDLDLEYIPAEYAGRYARFAERLRKVMDLFGYRVSAALAPKTSREQPGLLYEGMDYRLLGQAVHQVMLMTYEWGYAYGPPMAVAPLHMVRRVVDYALTEIPAQKLILGIPNYGYDWPLPYERGGQRARTLGNVEAVRLAVLNGAKIHFDNLAKSPYFHYERDGIRHEVWFEDVRSWKAKFDLVKEKGLKGAGIWQLMQLFRAGLLLMRDSFQAERAEDEGIRQGQERG